MAAARCTSASNYPNDRRTRTDRRRAPGFRHGAPIAWPVLALRSRKKVVQSGETWLASIPKIDRTSKAKRRSQSFAINALISTNLGKRCPRRAAFLNRRNGSYLSQAASPCFARNRAISAHTLQARATKGTYRRLIGNPPRLPSTNNLRDARRKKRPRANANM